MIVEFDTSLNLVSTAADLIDHPDYTADSWRKCYAAPPPHLLVVVFQPTAVVQLDRIPINIFHMRYGLAKAECQLDWYNADAPIGWTLPQYAGLLHIRLTIKRLVEASRPADITLSRIMAENVSTIDTMPGDPVSPKESGTQLTAILPPALIASAQRVAKRHGYTLDAAVWEALLRWTEDNL